METHKRLPLKRLAGLAFISILISCGNKERLVEIDPSYSRYIAAYTSGVVSKKTTVRIQIAPDAAATHILNETLKDNLFEFSPAVEGRAYWTDARTLEFKPDKDLKADQLYKVSFDLGKVINVPSKYRTFTFNIETLKPSFQVDDFGLKAMNRESMSLSGQIATADVEESAKVEKLLSATLDHTALKISWLHNDANRIHDFVINDIQRKTLAGHLILSWSGEPLGTGIKQQKEILVPAIGDFKVLDVRAVQDQEQYALVQFSDPLSIGQSLEGLIGVSQQENLSYTIVGSEVKVYTGGQLDGDYSVNVHEGISNQWGEKLSKAFASNIYFQNRLPAVKIQGRGNILPNSSGKLVLPFEATNLKAVDISVIKIYENNVAQFLQQNDLNGDEELRRVGKPMVQKTIRLDEDKSLNLHKTNRFSLDLDKYIRTEPGAIYRVQMAFQPQYSLYTCNASSSDDEDDEEGYYDYYYASNKSEADEDEEFWRRYEDFYPYGYNWNQKDNPCSKSYYNKDHFASRNILASNIGLIAKRGSDDLFVAATNILTTGPLSNVELDVLDYQQQVIGKANTNGDGVAMIALPRKPYLLIAKQGKERGYLKLDEGSSLPLSRFDVSGEEVREGIKGFIFGERGVWRPGDSLFLTCIIEDRDNKLPSDHPIELEVISPRGQLYKRMVQTNAHDGINVFRTATDADAPTGNWLCRVKVGNNTFEKKLKIETVMPNRLKIDLDFKGLDALGSNANVKGTLSAKWLFGATAQNLKARVDAQLYQKQTTFPKFKDYIFDNPTARFAAQSKTIFDGALSDDGNASINPAFDVGEQAPGQLLANLMVKVFEPGGNFSVDNISMPFNPYASYVGVHVPQGDKTWGFLLTGQKHRFDIADVDTKGNLVNGATNVEVSIYRIQWQWWWDNSDVVSNFTQDKYNKLIKKETVVLSNGKGFYDIKMDDGDWGRYLILLRDTRSGHICGSVFYVDDWGWQTRNDIRDPSAAAMLSFTSDKEKYNVGEDVILTIPTAEDDKALISIETGSKVLKTYWIKTQKGHTRFSFKTDKTMSPNIYVNVSVIQPHTQTINDLPIRMYGVIPVAVEDQHTFLRPVMKCPDEIRPQQENTITVSEASGKSMSYIIAIVDEGLLDLTRFKTPDPHNAFYAKEALGVKSWDVFDEVIGAWAGQLDRILTIGGDAEAELASKTRKANRFKPVVQFMGPFHLDRGSKTHTFTLPSYMGSVRAMLIAASENDAAYGFAEKSIRVKKPLMILTTLPRVLAPGEEVRIPVTVFATQNSIKNVKLSLQSNPLIEASGDQQISFSDKGEQLVYFTAKVRSSTGIGKIKIIATSGKEQAASETEIDVRNPNPPVTEVSEYTLQPGQSWSHSVSMIGTASTSKAVLEISSIPAINLEARLNYLVTYPHGCIEQTTSSVFPQLVLHQLINLNDPRKAEIERNILAGIRKLQNFQTGDGGFSYWPGYSESDEWGSNYAGHFLLEATARGYNVPASVLQAWKLYEHNKAVAWNVTSAPWYGTDLVQAYRLYLLALANAPELGAMNRLKEFKFITPEATWRLAAAYQLIGQSQVALKMISGLPTTFPQRPYTGVSFGSDLRDEAMVLETLTIMNRKAEATQLLKTVAARLSKEDWYSTQTTAYSLIAIAKFCGANGDEKKIMVTGKSGVQNLNVNTNTALFQTSIGWQGAKANVQLSNEGDNVLFVRIINEGQPTSNEQMPLINNPEVLKVQVRYLNASGEDMDITRIRQGTDFIAKVTVTNPGLRGVYNEMALSQIFPSGWEILNTRLYNTEGKFQSSASDYVDIRDDRVYHYFDIKPYQSLTYYVQLNAAYPGRYYWPGVYCEAMYDHSISGGIAGKQVEVVE